MNNRKLEDIEQDIVHVEFKLKRAKQHDWLREVDQYTFELQELENEKLETLKTIQNDK